MWLPPSFAGADASFTASQSVLRGGLHMQTIEVTLTIRVVGGAESTPVALPRELEDCDVRKTSFAADGAWTLGG